MAVSDTSGIESMVSLYPGGAKRNEPFEKTRHMTVASETSADTKHRMPKSIVDTRSLTYDFSEFLSLLYDFSADKQHHRIVTIRK